jgi:hypothetical protein
LRGRKGGGGLGVQGHVYARMVFFVTEYLSLCRWSFSFCLSVLSKVFWGCDTGMMMIGVSCYSVERLCLSVCVKNESSGAGGLSVTRVYRKAENRPFHWIFNYDIRMGPADPMKMSRWKHWAGKYQLFTDDTWMSTPPPHEAIDCAPPPLPTPNQDQHPHSFIRSPFQLIVYTLLCRLSTPSS